MKSPSNSPKAWLNAGKITQIFVTVHNFKSNNYCFCCGFLCPSGYNHNVIFNKGTLTSLLALMKMLFNMFTLLAVY